MKKLIIFFATFLFSAQITFNNSLLIPSSLKEKFISYWQARANKEFYKTFNYEMPYLRYLYSKDWYEDFFSSSPRFKSIYVKNFECKGNICFFTLLLKPKYSKDTIFYKDKWVKVDNTYYHRFNDLLLPR